MHLVVLRPNVELSGRQQRGALDSERKMGRRPCARWPARRAVGVPLERKVRPRALLTEQDVSHRWSYTPLRAEAAKACLRCRRLTPLDRGQPNR